MDYFVFATKLVLSLGRFVMMMEQIRALFVFPIFSLVVLAVSVVMQIALRVLLLSVIFV